MSDKLAKNIEWGKDLASLRQRGGEAGEAGEAAEAKLLAQYMLDIRNQLETNLQAREIAARAKPAIIAFSELAEILTPIIKPGTGDIFEKALEEILIELDQLRISEAGLILIDNETGKSILSLTPDMIYTPPDYIGDDGLVHKAKPILHPSISSALGLAAQDKSIILNQLEKARDPKTKLAYEHVANPNRITELAVERLKNIGVHITEDINGIQAKDIEFGREQVDGIRQAPNIRFHRANMFAAILATKVFRECGEKGLCSFGPIRLMKNAKQRWYLIGVKTLQAT
jgi:hypothetical protein